MCPPTILDYDSYLSLTAERSVWCEYLSGQQSPNLVPHFSLNIHLLRWATIIRKDPSTRTWNATSSADLTCDVSVIVSDLEWSLFCLWSTRGDISYTVRRPSRTYLFKLFFFFMFWVWSRTFIECILGEEGADGSWQTEITVVWRHGFIFRRSYMGVEVPFHVRIKKKKQT